MLLLIVDGGSSWSGELSTLWLVLSHAGALSLGSWCRSTCLQWGLQPQVGWQQGSQELAMSTLTWACHMAAVAEHVVPGVLNIWMPAAD